MESLLLLMKNALIGSIGGLLAWLIDLARGRAVSWTTALAKVLAGGFVAQVATPYLSSTLSINDQGFVSAILGIIGYKIIEYLLSGEFLDQVKKMLLLWLQK